jgi:hypothetical protein
MVRTRCAFCVGGLLVLVLAACSSFSASTDAPTDGGTDGGTPEGDASDASEAGDGGPLLDADAGTSAYAAVVLADRPIAYWRMGAKTGITIANEVGGSNALLLQGSVSLGAAGALNGDNDTAIRFDGLTKGYAVAENARPFDFANGAPFTIEWWAKHEPVDGGAPFQHMIGAAEGSTPVSGNGYFAYWSGDTQVQVEFAAPNHDVTLTAATPPGWKYYALVFDGANVSLVIDGTVEASKPPTGKLATRQSSFVVGATSGTTPSGIGGYGFAGLIDEVAVYDKALSLARINAHHQAAK